MVLVSTFKINVLIVTDHRKVICTKNWQKHNDQIRVERRTFTVETENICVSNEFSGDGLPL